MFNINNFYKLNTFNINNFYKLNTKEDATYIHKFLGIISLGNFIYRFANYIINDTMNLNNFTGIQLILVHGVLSISSLIFHIPTLLNPLKPMIYPEFRLHSILFGIRSVIAFLFHYYDFHYIHIIFLCYLTMFLADIITYNYNKEQKNGKTMRNMPFNNDIPISLQNEITFIHSSMQIGATTFMLGNMESAFAPLFAIQLAAFLMTLVRKSIISAKMWHSIYTLTLWINIILYKTLPLSFIFIQTFMYHNFKFFFFPNRVNKYISWSINFGLFLIYKEYELDKMIDTYFYNYFEIIYYFRIIFIMCLFYNLFNRFKILYIL